MAKANIHPKYHDVKISCTTCSTSFMSGSTKKDEIKIDTCSHCHPFYTGKVQFDRAVGQVEKYRSRVAKKEKIENTKPKDIKVDKVKNSEDAKNKKDLTLEDLRNIVK